ncbi:MAG: hypothetical protein J6S85_04545 [Methanobrevibacter sp.]|nr:hypothetical protein [Methanobrevibacter sp.]
MAKYTIELRKIIENFYSRDEVESWFKDYCLNNYLRQNEIETILNANIWSKDRLASKIVSHYYMREIGYETIALFKHYAKVYMQEIMERYLPLIYSKSIEYDPLINVDYQEEFTRNISGSGESESESSSSNSASGLSVSSDTPQGQITKANILAGNYASNTGASETESEISDSTSSSNSNTTDETYTKKVKGNSGVSATAQRMIAQYRENIIAIDEQIIKELDKLFMGLY